MNTTSLLLGIIPLLIFVIVDSFSNLKIALITAIILSIAEALFTYIYFGELDTVTGFSLLLVIIFAIGSYKTKNELYIKLQPVVVSAILSAMLFISWVTDKAIILEMALKYKEFLPTNMHYALKNELFRSFLIHSTFTLSIGLLIHSAITALAAYKLNNWWWIAVRGIGFYLIVFFCQLVSRFIIFG